MKTKYSPEKGDPVTSFCEATSECRGLALFYLEGSSWDLDEAVSSFLSGQLPPINKKPLKPSPSKWKQKYSVTSGLKSKWSSYTDFENSLDDSKEHLRVITKEDSSHDSNDISLEEKIVTMPNHVNHEFEEEGSGKAANESTSIEIVLPLPDHVSDSSS